tara:strand:- start:2142 stop:3485 length:1344 start_codon:yes stop_codon:yes gene_type:complete
MDWMTEEERKKVLIAAAASGTAGIAMTKGNSTIGTRVKYLDTMKNYLDGFYSGKPGAKIFASGKEAIAGNLDIMKNFANPAESYAHDVTGLSNRAHQQLISQQQQINTLRNNSLKLIDDKKNILPRKKTAYNNIRKDISKLQKKQHYKIINDYSNRFLFNNKGLTATDDVARYAQQFVSKIDNPVKAQPYMGGSKEAMSWIAKQQGVKNQRHALYLLHKTVPKHGDVLRGMQFHNPTYRIFQDMNRIGGKDFSKLTSKKVEAILKSSKMNHKKINGKFYFNASPARKSNFDWGGYNGVVEWNPTKRDKLTFYANDKRDLFKMKFGGRDVINVVQPKTITIPEAELRISASLNPKKQKEIVEKIARSTRGPDKARIASNLYFPGNTKKGVKDIEIMTQARKEILKKKVPWKYIPKFMARRFGFGIAGISAMAVLALMSTVAKDRETAQ